MPKALFYKDERIPIGLMGIPLTNEEIDDIWDEVFNPTQTENNEEEEEES